MGGSTTTDTQQASQSVQQLPPWINQAAQQNYALAQNISQQPLQQYQGQMVADVAPQMQQSWNTAASGGNAGADQYAASQAGYQGVLGQAPQQVTAAQLSQQNLQPYMNPYTQSVINKTMPIMQQQLGQQQIGNQSQAAGAGAYGGSRQAIQQGVTQAQGAMNMGQMAAQLNQANFGQAQQGALADVASQNQAALANQAAQQQQANTNVAAATGLANLGTAAQQSQARNFTEQMTAGQAQQQQAQNELNAQQQKFQAAWGYPYQQLGVLQSALGQTPYGTATQGQSQGQTVQTQSNPMGNIMGGLTSLGSMFGSGGMFGAGGAFAMGGSDRRLKTDITRVGTHSTGIPIHAYRYKGDPKTYPKIIGPMAEDVQKIAPGAVAKIPGSGGKMAVHMGALNALGAMGGGVSRGTPPGQPPIGMPPMPMGGPPPGQPPITGMAPASGVAPTMPMPRAPRPGLSMGGPGMAGPGPLAAAVPGGGMGALASSLRRPRGGMPRRPPPIRMTGALGGLGG
jgi:hypothetical protein